MTVKVCTVCGAEFVANSNRQKYCSACKDDVRRAQMCDVRRAQRARNVALDKASYSLAPNLRKSADGSVDFEAEARKVANEKKRTYRNYGSSSYREDKSTAARKAALENFTYDVRNDDFKGSIEDFFAGKDD
jgi:hypothetical protein